MHKFYSVLLFLFSFLALNGQGEAKRSDLEFVRCNYHLEANYGLGRIVRHNSLFGPEVTELSHAFEFSYLRNTNGQKYWHQLSNYPSFISTFQYGSFGDKEIFGSVYALMIGLEHSKRINFLGNSILNRNIKYRGGPSWLDSPFDLISNIDNNVIGTHLNLTLRLDYGYELILSEQLGIQLSATAQHYSNGKSALPNLGINMFSANLALRYYSDGKYLMKKNQSPKPSVELSKKHHLNLRMGFGRHENFIANGPKFPIYTFSVYASKNRGPLWTWLYGVEGSYYQSVSQYILENETGDENPHRVATRLVPFGGFEVTLGLTSLVGTVGSYFYKPFLADGFLPTKLGVQQYLPAFKDDQAPSLFIGGYLKAHGAKAEYLEMGLGYRF